MRKPRSTECRVCVKRHVRCDETRPYWRKYSEMGLVCDGFPTSLRIVDETRQTQERLTTPGAKRTSKTIPGAKIWRPSPKITNYKWISKPSIGNELRESPTMVYFCFLNHQFFATDRFRELHGNQTWVTACFPDEESSSTAALAMRGLAAGYFGRTNGQKHIVDDGSWLYGRALIGLRKDSDDTEKRLSYKTLAATMILSLYEYVAFTTRQCWMQHWEGVAKIIEFRGPESFVKYPDRAILDMNRQILIVHALAARRRTFLEDREWRKIAWTEGTKRPLMVRQLDIFHSSAWFDRGSSFLSPQSRFWQSLLSHVTDQSWPDCRGSKGTGDADALPPLPKNK